MNTGLTLGSGAAREGKDLNDRASEITINAVKMASEVTDKTIEYIEEIS